MPIIPGPVVCREKQRMPEAKEEGKRQSEANVTQNKKCYAKSTIQRTKKQRGQFRERKIEALLGNVCMLKSGPVQFQVVRISFLQ